MDTDRMKADIEARVAGLRRERDAALLTLGRLDGQITALTEVLSGMVAPPAAAPVQSLWGNWQQAEGNDAPA